MESGLEIIAFNRVVLKWKLEQSRNAHHTSTHLLLNMPKNRQRKRRKPKTVKSVEVETF